MKRSPNMARLEETLRSSRLAQGGFLGTDRRPLEEIIEADAATLARHGRSLAEVAARMRQISALAEQHFGARVDIGVDIEAAATDTRGVLPCPWPHPGNYPKTVVTVRDRRSGRSVSWSMLSIHLIEAHGFFEGKGTPFRIEPEELLDLIGVSGGGAPCSP